MATRHVSLVNFKTKSNRIVQWSSIKWSREIKSRFGKGSCSLLESNVFFRGFKFSRVKRTRPFAKTIIRWLETTLRLPSNVLLRHSRFRLKIALFFHRIFSLRKGWRKDDSRTRLSSSFKFVSLHVQLCIIVQSKRIL